MQFAATHEKQLTNGMRIVFVERPGLPVVTAGLLIRAGAEADPASLGGLAQFTGGLLNRGTANRSATQIAQDLEGLGASVKVEAGWDETVAMLTTLSNETGPSLDILAELIRKPAFAKDEVERLRKETIDELTVNLEQPGQLARVAAVRAILDNQPYGHSSGGTPASVKRIARPDIVKFHELNYRPDRAVLIIAGNLQAEEAFGLAEKSFGDWSAPASQEPTPQKLANPPEGGAILIDQPTAGQAAVYIGRAAPSWRPEEYFIGEVANNVLGGGYSARLNREVRVKRGLSYGCASRYYAYRGAGLFAASAQTKNESSAEVVQVINGELDRLGNEAIPADEFTARKAVLTGGFQRELETNEGYVTRIANFVVHDEKPDSFADSLARMEKVTAEDAQAFAKKEFNSKAMTVIVVGQAKTCEKPLRELLAKLRVIPQSKLDLDSASLTKKAGK
jgi:zinc protease